jgi:hypothetical protein
MANFKLLGRNGKMAARVFNFQKYKPLQVLQEQAPVQIVMGGIGGGGFGGGFGGGLGGTTAKNGSNGCGYYNFLGEYVPCGSSGGDEE